MRQVLFLTFKSRIAHGFGNRWRVLTSSEGEMRERKNMTESSYSITFYIAKDAFTGTLTLTSATTCLDFVRIPFSWFKSAEEPFNTFSALDRPLEKRKRVYFKTKLCKRVGGDRKNIPHLPKVLIKSFLRSNVAIE